MIGVYLHNPLRTPDFTQTFEHPAFDELVAIYKEALEAQMLVRPNRGRVVINGNVNGSDIKWNNFSGSVVLNAYHDDKLIVTISSCNLDCFTGNCGVKAIDHLYIWRHPNIPETPSRRFIELFESFAYHRLNCGYLIGSDSIGNFTGSTLDLLSRFGTGYVVSPPTWNPNYTWNRSHQIAIFSKDLNAQTHHNYWS